MSRYGLADNVPNEIEAEKGELILISGWEEALTGARPQARKLACLQHGDHVHRVYAVPSPGLTHGKLWVLSEMTNVPGTWVLGMLA